MNTVVATRLADANIALDDGGWNYLILKLDEAEALRKLLEEEKDARLGRWRDPEDPSFVVYPDGPDRVRVVDERDSTALRWSRPQAEDDEYSPNFGFDTARAYFKAHPPRKPWHAAKEGEAWLITTDTTPEGVATLPIERGGVTRFETADTQWHLDSPLITSGRRLWPVAEEADQ